jgi:hypothetical protein
MDTEFFRGKPSRLNSQTGPARHGESNTGGRRFKVFLKKDNGKSPAFRFIEATTQLL